MMYNDTNRPWPAYMIYIMMQTGLGVAYMMYNDANRPWRAYMMYNDANRPWCGIYDV